MKTKKPTNGLFAPDPNVRTLFIAAGNSAAVLVTPIGAKHRQRTMRFPDPHAALTWCERHGANLVYTAQPRADPARN